MSRVFMRRGRILPGPLKVLQQAERPSPVPMASIALTSAIMAVALLLMPQFLPRASVDPKPMPASAEPELPNSDAHASVASAAFAATPAPTEPVVMVPPAQVAGIAAEPDRPAPPAPVKRAVAAPSKPVVERSLFQLDLLPVLQASGEDLDVGGASGPSPRPSPKAPARRTTAANRGATVDSAQP